MNAAVMTSNGSPDVFSFQDISKPEPKPGEVLVKTAYAALNYVDIWVRKGSPAYTISMPHVLGADGAGIISDLGKDAEGVTAGDPVVIFPAISCGLCVFCKAGQDNQCDTFEILGTKRWGSYADFIAVPDQNVAAVPPHFPLDKAAAFSLTYLTAWHMLVGRAQIKQGETVLIVGASAGVSVAAIQIATLFEATVYAVTSSEEKAEAAKKIGAHHVFVSKEGSDYSTWVKDLTQGRGVDIVIEHVGPATWEKSLASLKKYGRMAICGETTGPTVNLTLRALFGKDIALFGARMGTKKEFQEVCRLVFAGKLNPVIDQVLPLSEAKKAHQLMEEKNKVGKILLRTDRSDQ